MSIEHTCIKVQKSLGEKTLILLNKLRITENKLEIQRDEESIYVPLISQPTESNLKTIKKQAPDFEITTRSFPLRKKQEKSLAERLEKELPAHLRTLLPHAIDFVGNIAIVEIPPELNMWKTKVGEAILDANQNVRTVLAKAGSIDGEYRLRKFTVIAGEHKTETVHKEYGCQYYLDITEAYFSPRLSYEHNRVASFVMEGETVVDMFAGVGPFAIQIAKTRKNVEVYAIDVNPRAVEYLKRNTRLNKVVGTVHPILGDARHVVKERLVGVADRVIMNLPEKAIEFVDVACDALKPSGGVAHFYTFVDASASLKSTQLSFRKATEECGRKVKRILSSKLVRATAPYEWQAVLDVKIH